MVPDGKHILLEDRGFFFFLHLSFSFIIDEAKYFKLYCMSTFKKITKAFAHTLINNVDKDSLLLQEFDFVP